MVAVVQVPSTVTTSSPGTQPVSVCRGIAAACALDAGTQMFSPENTSKVYGDTFGKIDEFAKPIQAVAKGT